MTNGPTRPAEVPPFPVGIADSVREFYKAHPYPQWTKAERHRRFGAELARYRYLGLAETMPKARLLDAGCGTGNRSMLAAKHFGVAEFVGLDRSPCSLQVARSVAEEEGFERFTPVEGDVLAMPLDDASFDVVVSWGVLHHTPDARQGLAEMVRVCRPGGRLAIFVYNKWNHWRHNMQKRRVDQLAGENVEKRFDVSRRLFGDGNTADMSPQQIVEWYDQYCHPHKTDHTYGEILSWFDELGLEFLGSYPPLRLRDFIGYTRYRASLLSEYPSSRRFHSGLLRTLAKIPVSGRQRPPFARPTWIHRAFWQARLAWQGRHGAYSAGASFSARKPE